MSPEREKFDNTLLIVLLVLAIAMVALATAAHVAFPPEPRCAPWKTPVIVNHKEVHCVYR